MPLRSIVTLVAAFALLSCSESTGSSNPAVGTWRLQTVNGQPLPFTLEQSASERLDLTAEAMTLSAAGKVDMVTTFRLTRGNDVETETIPDQGTFTISGSTVSFVFPSDGSTPQATINGDTMTLGDIGLTFVYRRD